MTIVNGYCTEDQLRAWNGASSSVAGTIIERAIGACSRGIEQHCQRLFWKTAGGTHRFLDAKDCHLLKLGVFLDVVTVSAVATDDNRDGVFETTWATGDYQLGPLNPEAAPEATPYRYLRAIGSRSFPRRLRDRDREGLVRVTGEWGWPAIPTDVEQACLIHAARIFTRKESPQGVAGWGDFGAIRVRSTDPDVVDLLEPYIHPMKVLAA